jgi:preprotein translocase subunit SecB
MISFLKAIPDRPDCRGMPYPQWSLLLVAVPAFSFLRKVVTNLPRRAGYRSIRLAPVAYGLPPA